MDDIRAKAKALVEQMTLEEKASLCSGKDFWHFKGIERLGLPSVLVTDGPHGLRKQSEGADQLGIGDSVPATCFPAASASACSFDTALLYEIGKAIGEECREEDVAVILGPGMNIKRSPLCGRNFEYFSEDPTLTGELAAAFTQGVQSQNVGVSCKHFALNNQETRRMTTESVCDERAFREIYLSAFEHAVKKARPWTAMCSYNKLYGSYVSDSRLLLNDILREEWGFDGLVVSDWGASNDRVAGVHAGLDMEMPAVSDESDRAVAAAVRNGALSEADLNRCAENVVALILKSQQRQKLTGCKPSHHELARRAARESAVLLKNDGGLLPGNTAQSAAVIGAFAKHPRYQGAGSSKINPTKLDNAFEELAALGLAFDYAAGYDLAEDRPQEALIAEACKIAQGKDIVYLFAGLPDRYESEGFDRSKISMPEAHTELIRRVFAVNPNVAVILSGGWVMDLSWEGAAKAILLSYLGGQAGAGAVADLLLGRGSPCGKLAESWPIALEDNPSYAYFPGYQKAVEYRESIYVGYRYYDAANKGVRYPFGYGLSYTEFVYDNLRVENLEVRVDIQNTGKREGKEIVQLYVSPPKSVLYKAPQELKHFGKVQLAPGGKATLTFTLSERDFAFYDVNAKDWRVEAGDYEIRIGASSRDIRLAAKVTVEENHAFTTPVPDYGAVAPCYYDLSSGIAHVPDEAFLAVYGRPLPVRARQEGEPHTVNSTFEDIQDKWLGRVLAAQMRKQTQKMGDEEMQRMIENVMREAPLRMLTMMGGKQFTANRLAGLVDMLNGKTLSGIGKLFAKGK